MRANIHLSEREQKELKQRKQGEKSIKIYRRYQYLELSNRGMTNLEIAEILGVTNDTLTDWRQLFLQGGLDALSELHYEGRRESRIAPYQEQIKEYIIKENVGTLAQLQGYLEKTYKIEISQSWLFRYCKKNSIFLTKKPDLFRESQLPRNVKRQL